MCFLASLPDEIGAKADIERIFAFPLDVPLRLFYTAICAKRFALYDRTMVKNHG